MTSWMSLQEFCEKTGFKYQTAYKWVNDGTIPGSRIPHGKKSKYLIDSKAAFEKFERLRIAQ